MINLIRKISIDERLIPELTTRYKAVAQATWQEVTARLRKHALCRCALR